MILYQKELHPTFRDYGIDIPISDDRASRCFETLKAEFSPLPVVPFDSTKTITKEDLLLCHTSEYVDQIFNDPIKAVAKAYELYDSEGNCKRYDPMGAKFPLSDLVKNKLSQASGTYQAMEHALRDDFCYYLSGGMHHAMSTHGSGFCLVNDIVIGIRKLQAEGKIKTAWVIDIDAHKGDGTAELCQNDRTISTFSIHMKDGWPLDNRDENPQSFIPSDVDVPIAPSENWEYLEKLKAGLREMFRFPLPDIAIIVDGADPFEGDALESSSGIKLSESEMLKRDRIVYEFLRDKKIPQTYLIAGGYGKDSWRIYSNFLSSILREQEGAV